MKHSLILLLTLFASISHAQDKYNYVHFNKLTEVKGTAFVIASMENWGKMYEDQGDDLVFINTRTGESHRVDFPKDAGIAMMQQVKIDNLDINQIIVQAKTIDLNEKTGIDWNDPAQVFIVSTDGKQKTQLTDSKLFVRTWVVNEQTGTIVITGHYDTNNNRKYDKTDQNEINIYDLKTLKLLSKI